MWKRYLPHTQAYSKTVLFFTQCLEWKRIRYLCENLHKETLSDILSYLFRLYLRKLLNFFSGVGVVETGFYYVAVALAVLELYCVDQAGIWTHKTFKKHIYFYLMCMSVFLACMFVHRGSVEARRRCPIPWNLS